MKLLVRLLRRVRQQHKHPAGTDLLSGIGQIQDRFGMADIVRILRAQDGNLAIERARYRVTANAAAERKNAASREGEAPD
jgi:glutamate 5-kinase